MKEIVTKDIMSDLLFMAVGKSYQTLRSAWRLEKIEQPAFIDSASFIEHCYPV